MSLLRRSPLSAEQLQQLAEQDVQSNAEGKLTSRQRWRTIGQRTAEHAIGGLSVALVVAVAFYILRLQPEPPIPLLIVSAIALITMIYLLVNLRPVFSSQVQSVQGVATRRVIGGVGMPLQPFYCVTIGDKLFYVDETQFREIKDDEEYQVFFLPRPERVGGATWLSARPIPSTPITIMQ